MIKEDAEPQVNVTKLSNGVQILTETAKFPTSVNMGVLLHAGTRDETAETSGVMMALKNTYLKTNTRTNEQLNYCMAQIAGGAVSMNYDQETAFYKGHCLSHDFYDYAQMFADMILDEKTAMDEEAAQWRADEYFKLRDENITNARRVEELWLQVAYGNAGLGNPLPGLQSKFQSIAYKMINDFRRDVVTPDRMVICAGGVYSHQEFVDTMTPYFQYLTRKTPAKQAPAQYFGGEARELTESDDTWIHLSFQSVPWTSPELTAVDVLHSIVSPPAGGQVANCRANTHFLQKH